MSWVLVFLKQFIKKALKVLLLEKGLKVQEEAPYAISFRTQNIGFYYADIVVENKVIIELKRCKNLLSEHQAQVINYLKAAKLPVGILVNFGQRNVDIKRLYNHS